MRKISTILLIVLSLSLIIYPAIEHAYIQNGKHNTDRNAVTIVTFGDSREELVAQKTLLTLIPTAEVIEYSLKTQMLGHSSSLIIFVGHGNKNGIIYQQHNINWDSLINKVPKSARIGFLACNSPSNEKRIFGFGNNIDAIIGATYFATIYFLLNQDVSSAAKALIVMRNRLNQLVSGCKPLNLAYTESGYQLAVKDQYRSASRWRVTYYKEHIMWINGLSWVAKEFLTVASFGVSAVITLGWVKILASMLGISYVTLSILLLAALTAMKMTLYYNMGQRRRGDFMFGISAEIIPIRVLKVWIDNGNDHYNNDGRYYWPVVDFTTLSPLSLYSSISRLPDSWAPLIR